MNSLSTILNVTTDQDSTLYVCFNRSVDNDPTLWLNESLQNTVPPFILQLGVILALNRIFMILSESCHIPRTVCNIFAGALIGPSALGQWRVFNSNVYPMYNVMSVEIIASLVLVYYVFLVGLEMDMKPLGTCHNKKAISVALAGVIFSAPIGFGLSYLLLTNMRRQSVPVTNIIVHARGAVIWAITLSCSDFPEIAKVLSEQKLLLTENGQLALTASLVSDVISCIFFIMNVLQQLDSQTFSVMLMACWLMTIPMGPLLAAWKKTLKTVGFSSHNTMQATGQDSPLRAAACIHSTIDATVVLNFLKASCPSVKSPIQVVAIELVKMTAHRSREASSLIVRRSRSVNRNKAKASTTNKTDIEENGSDKDVLGSFDDLSQAIFAEKMKVVSAYDTMHKDIISIAKQRGVTLILTAFYKHPTYDGLGAGAATARAANIINKDRASKDEKKVVLENLLSETPCCLAILVDRGFGDRKSHKTTKLAMIYVSGADDREALSYAWRMSQNTDVKLTVVRVVWNDANSEFGEADEEFLRLFRHQTRGLPCVRYVEKEVKDEMETMSLLNKIGSKGYDLILIGRGDGRKMSLAQTTGPVLEEPALGPLGDTLADLNSAAETSIMVMPRQCGRGEENGKHVRSTSLVGKFVERETCLGSNVTE